MDNSEIIKRIEIRLAELGMSKSEFYKKTKITSASYSQWNTGRYRPSEANLRKIADCLNISYEYLYLGISENLTLTEEQKENSPGQIELTEGEVELIKIFRLIPEEQQRLFLEMGRAFANSLKKD